MARRWTQRIARKAALGAAVSTVCLLGLGQSMFAAAPRASAAAPAGHPPVAWNALTRAEARALSAHVSDRVIVILRDQERGLPANSAHEVARAAAFESLQRPLLAQLAQTHAARIHAYRLIDAVAATMSPGEARRLAHNPAVLEVVPDVTVRLTAPDLLSAPATGSLTAPPATPPDNACPGWVQLDPQADEAVNAVSGYKAQPTAASLGYTGAGVKVGFIADGIDINNPNFIRPDGQHVFVDYKDFSGDGTATPTDGREAFLDAGSIAAQGTVVYDVSHYTYLPSAVPCRIRIEGVAPGVSLVGIDVIGNAGGATLSVLVQGVDWAVTHDHVDVLNESIGGSSFPDVEALDAFDMADDAAVAAGVTVVTSSGDSGPTNTIGSPASDPNVISVGASTTYRIYAQTGIGAAQRPGVTGWLNNNTSPFSSSGETETGRTIDLVAPGDYNWLPCSIDVAIYQGCRNDRNQPTPVQAIGGTSESSPVTAGVAALVIQAYREAHAGTTPAPAVVKQILLSTANPIGAPADQQGAGLLDAYRAVLAARSYGEPAARASGETTLLSPAQIDVAAAPSSPETLTETVTNNGASS
ncbi:MAG: S8 family peptidase, partial [Acidimicrobiales bacterium]